MSTNPIAAAHRGVTRWLSMMTKYGLTLLLIWGSWLYLAFGWVDHQFSGSLIALVTALCVFVSFVTGRYFLRRYRRGAW